MIPVQPEPIIRAIEKLIRQTDQDWHNEKNLQKRLVIADQKKGMEKALEAAQDNFDHQQRTFEQVANG